MILAGGKYLAIKAYLHLSHVPILLRGKDENQVLALSLSEKEIILISQYHYPYPFYFACHIIQQRY